MALSAARVSYSPVSTSPVFADDSRNIPSQAGTLWSWKACARGATLGVNPDRRPSCRGAVKRAAGGARAAGGGTSIHKLLERDGSVLMPGCYDALSATIIEKQGFSAAFISGYATSASLLGKPDFGLLTPPEMCATARFVCNTVRIPVIVDADTGGGNALNVRRTVKELIAAGAAGCFLEDQVWPKKCGHMRGKQVIPAEEHAAKIAAAREAIGDADFFLVARTDARATSKLHGLEDAISRANLYMEAGADASFVEAPRNADELKEVGNSTKGPRVCNMLEGGLTPLHTPQELQEMGFQIVVHPLTALYAATRALLDILGELREKGTTKGHLHKLSTFEEFNELIGLKDWYEIEEKYSKGGSEPSYSTLTSRSS